MLKVVEHCHANQGLAMRVRRVSHTTAVYQRGVSVRRTGCMSHGFARIWIIGVGHRCINHAPLWRRPGERARVLRAPYRESVLGNSGRVLFELGASLFGSMDSLFSLHRTALD